MRPNHGTEATGPDGKEAERLSLPTSPISQATNLRTQAAVSRGSSCSAQDLPTDADGVLSPSGNPLAVASRLSRVDSRIQSNSNPSASTSRGGGAFVASRDRSVWRRPFDARRQPP